MKEICRTDVYIKWIRNLNDSNAKARIAARVDRLAEGNAGDWKAESDIANAKDIAKKLEEKDDKNK
jgi:putative component of toxin-antitoxin plasmid stabilization module